jgi:[acyl-carrier-protein] S-malonyltransferase
MGKALAEEYPIARELFVEADDLLQVNLSRLAWEGPEDALNDTINTQPALFVHSIAALRVLEETRPDWNPLLVAGHSMGELSALVAAGCISFENGLHLVRTRGELMKRAGELSPGGMAAVLGLEIDILEGICSSSSTPPEPVQIANDNCPGQIVISGAAPALKRAMQRALDAGARRVVPLAVSIAAHSPLMKSAQNEFNRAVASIPMADPRVPIIGNVTAGPLARSSEIRSDLQAQLNSRVRWTESIHYMGQSGVTAYLELGNSAVLTGLLKRIDRQAQGIPLGNPADFEKLPSSLTPNT